MKKEYLFLTLTVLLWGSVHPVGKIILTEITPSQFGLVRWFPNIPLPDRAWLYLHRDSEENR